MQLRYAIVLLLVFSCSQVMADEPVPSQRFSIVQAVSRTILLDRVSGTTWLLEEPPQLRWKKIPQDPALPLLSDPDAERGLHATALKIVAAPIKSAEAAKGILVRASVFNKASAPCEGITVSFVPDQATITSATIDGLTLNPGRCVWEVDRLGVGETKVFEAQLIYAKKFVGEKPKLMWTVRDDSGAQLTQTMRIAITEPVVFHGSIPSQPKSGTARDAK